MKSKRGREEPCFICGHYHDYEGGEPCGTCGHVISQQEKKQCETVLPTAIIPGFLYLGSYDTASRSEILKAMAITHILNTVPSCEALYKNTFQYHTVSTSPPQFQECFDFIDSVNQQSDHSKVLVYCMSGLSRSPTIIIAYLMRARGWRLLESYKWVKQKRGSINLNAEDKKRLIDMELQVYNSCSVPEGFDAVDTHNPGAFDVSASGGRNESSQSSTAEATPTFAVPAGQNRWSLSPGAGALAIASAPAAESEPSFIFGTAASQSALAGPPSNAEMEM